MEKCSEMHKQPWESVWLINVMYLPIYMLMFIQKHPAVEKQIYHFDLSNL